MVVPLLDTLSGVFFGLVAYPLFGAQAASEGLSFDAYMDRLQKSSVNPAAALLKLEDNPKWWFGLQKALEFILWWTIIQVRTYAFIRIVHDVVGERISSKRGRWITTAGVSIVNMGLLVISSTVNGEIVMNQIHSLLNSMLPVFSLLLTIGLAWIYGSRRFIMDMEAMMGFEISILMDESYKDTVQVLIGLITPLGLAFIILVTTINDAEKLETAHDWQKALFYAIRIVFIAFFAIKLLFSFPIGKSIRPTDKWGPENSTDRRMFRQQLGINKDEPLMETTHDSSTALQARNSTQAMSDKRDSMMLRKESSTFLDELLQQHHKR